MNKTSSTLASFILFCIVSSTVYGSNFENRAFISGQLKQFDSLLSINRSEAFALLKKASLLLSNKSEKKLNSLILNCYSKWYNETKQCDSAILYARLAWQECSEDSGRMLSVRYIGNAHVCAGQTDSALFYYIKAERLAQKIKDTFALAICNYNIGSVLAEQGKLTKSLEYFKLSSSLANSCRKFEHVARNEISIAIILAQLNQTERAIQSLNKCLRFYRKVKYPAQIALVCNNLANVYFRLGDYNKAIVYYKESSQINENIGRLDLVCRELSNIAAALIYQQRYNEAITILLKALHLCKQLKGNPNLAEIYHNLSYSYLQILDYKNAYLFKDLQKDVTDSLRSLETLKNTERLQEEFEAEKRTLEISSLKKENEVKELKSQAHLKQRNGFIALAIGLFGVALLVFFFLRQRVLNARQLNEKNKQIHQQQMDEVIHKSELQSIHTMIETQEKERRRIAQDLHDRVGSMLSTVKLQFGHFNTTEKTDKAQLNKVSHLLDDAVEEIRQVSHNLVSGVLSTFGLVPALKDLIQALGDSSRLEIHLQVYGMDERMESEMEINLYRILQELFNNTIRHAKAGRVDIELSRHRGELNLMYSDNGIGFNTAAQKQGIGLKNINARVDKLGGSLHIDSGKGNGSTFVFNFPLI